MTDSAYYQPLISILQLDTELDCIDITYEVSMIVSMIAISQIEHLNQLFYMFTYLKLKDNSKMTIDPKFPSINTYQFLSED